MGLRDPGALPLVTGDLVRLEAEVQPAAFLYLFWVDSEGQASPVFPWQPGRWGTRPAKEEPREGLNLPPQANKAWPMARGPRGMETILLLALDRPLQVPDEELKKLLAGLPAQQSLQDERAAIWFENGEVIRDEPKRAPAFFAAEEVDDPVLRLQQVLREKLQPLARYSRAVSFARQGP